MDHTRTQVIKLLLRDYRDKFVKLNEKEKGFITQEIDLSKSVFISEFLLEFNDKIISLVFINNIKRDIDHFESYGPYKSAEFLYKVSEILKNPKYSMPIKYKQGDEKPYATIIAEAVKIECDIIKNSLFYGSLNKRNKEFLTSFNEDYYGVYGEKLRLEIHVSRSKRDEIIIFLKREMEKVEKVKEYKEKEKQKLSNEIFKFKEWHKNNKQRAPNMLNTIYKRAYAAYTYPNILNISKNEPKEILFPLINDEERNPIFISTKGELDEQLITFGLTKNGLLFIEISERLKVKKALSLLRKKGFDKDDCNRLLETVMLYKRESWDLNDFLYKLEGKGAGNISLAVKEIEPIVDKIIGEDKENYDKKALELFNVFVSLVNLEEVNLMSIRQQDVYKAMVYNKGIELDLLLDPEKLYYKLDLFLQNDNLDKNNYYNRDEISEKLKDSISVHKHPELVKYLSFYAAAFSQFKMSAYEESFIMSWTMVEQHFYEIFKRRFTKIRKKFYTEKVRDKKLGEIESPEEVLEKVASFGRVFNWLKKTNSINKSKSKLIEDLYTIRKKLVHSASYIKSKDAKMCLKLFEVILKKKLENKDIKINNKIDKNNLHGKL
jgi:hypothetical protein